MTDKPNNNRLAELRGNVPQGEFAASIGLRQSNYWKYENGINRLNSDLILTICQTYGCSAEWLLGLSDDFYGPSNSYISLPVVDCIHSEDIDSINSYEDKFPVPKRIAAERPSAFLLRNNSSSMNRTLPEGVLVLIDPDSTKPDGHSVFAVCVNDAEAVLMRVRELGNGYELVPDSFDPTQRAQIFDFGSEDADTVTIIGKAVWMTAPYDYEI